MAKLPRKAHKILAQCASNFRSSTRINFNYDEFENRAEELELTSPGMGYQLAYEETMTNMFKGLFERHLNNERFTPSFSDLIIHYNSSLMKMYIQQRMEYGMDVGIDMDEDTVSVRLLEKFDNILNEKPSTTVFYKVSQKFDSGELTLNSTYDYAKEMKRKNAVPTKEEALELLSYAEYLQNRNEDRPILWMILNFWTHFKELFAISAMRELASKREEDVDKLKEEATLEHKNLRDFRNEVKAKLLVERAKQQDVFTDSVIDTLNKRYDDESFEKEIDPDKLYNVNERDISRLIGENDLNDEEIKLEVQEDEKNDLFNQTLDLNDDGNGMGDKYPEENEPLLDQSVIEGNGLEIDNDEDNDLAMSLDELLKKEDDEVNEKKEEIVNESKNDLNNFEKVEFMENEFNDVQDNSNLSEFNPEPPSIDDKVINK